MTQVAHEHAALRGPAGSRSEIVHENWKYKLIQGQDEQTKYASGKKWPWGDSDTGAHGVWVSPVRLISPATAHLLLFGDFHCGWIDLRFFIINNGALWDVVTCVDNTGRVRTGKLPEHFRPIARRKAANFGKFVMVSLQHRDKGWKDPYAWDYAPKSPTNQLVNHMIRECEQCRTNQDSES